MPKLPVLSGKELIKKLNGFGYISVRQKGSHVRLRHEDKTRKPITVPLHKNIKPGLLIKIVKDTGISTDEFIS